MAELKLSDSTPAVGSWIVPAHAEAARHAIAAHPENKCPRSIADPSAGIRLTGKEGPSSVGFLATDDRSPGLAVPDYSPYAGIRSYFTIARVSRDIFRQSSVGAIYTDWECPATGEFNRMGGLDTRLTLSPTWTLEGQAVATSSYLNLNCEANLYPFSSGNVGNGNYYAGPAER